jgi:uncharacterized delta-60 repeat protein
VKSRLGTARRIRSASRPALLACAILILGIDRAWAAAGEFDPTFGTGGFWSEKLAPTANESARAAALQDDGRILVVGGHTPIHPGYLALLRFGVDGRLDPSFAEGGKALLRLGDGGRFGGAVAVQPGGDILVATLSSSSGEPRQFLVARYDPDGTLDASFSKVGILATGVSGTFATSRSLAVQADGKFLLAGYIGSKRGDDFTISRYEWDGTIDTSFGASGKVVTDIAHGNDRATSVVIQSDGKILVAGDVEIGDNTHFGVARYNEDGTLDESFAGTGAVVTEFGDVRRSYRQQSLALQPDGRIIATAVPSAGRPSTMVRYHPNGSVDTSFGEAGFAPIELHSATTTIQPDGRILLGGGTLNGNLWLYRYEPDGAPDPSFGVNGRIRGYDLGGWVGTFSWAAEVLVQGDGRIVVTGANEVGFYNFLVFRLKGGPVCGNGFLDDGEQCDDGNTDDRDCCTATCSSKPAGTPCSDGDVCSGEESCDGGGTCEPGEPLVCGDGDACTRDSCDPAEGCRNDPAPALCSHTWTHGSLLAREDLPGRERLVVKLFDGPALTQSDLGMPTDPAGTSYAVCVYDDAARLAGRLEIGGGDGDCQGDRCWAPIGRIGYSYENVAGGADGVRRLKLVGGGDGSSKIFLHAANDSFAGKNGLPLGIATFLAGSRFSTVQIHRSDAETPACFSAELPTVRDGAGSFRAAQWTASGWPAPTRSTP